jgi:hypothetical protein
MYDATFKLLSPKTVFQNKLFSKSSNFVIPSNKSFGDMNNTIFEFTNPTYVEGTKYFDLVSDTSVKSFDHTLRKWSTNDYTFNKKSKTDYHLDKYSKKYKQNLDFIDKKLKYKNTYAPLNMGKIRSDIEELTLYGDVIKFKTIGLIHRDIGELITLQSEDNALNDRYGGYWMILRIYHKFENSAYINEIYAVRNEKGKVDNV